MGTKVSTAIAQALTDLGVNTVTNVPGFGGSEVLEDYKILAQKNTPISFNEEVAYTIAHGSSIAGVRSAAIMKTQGLAKAANSIVDSLYTDITAGFVVFVFDDKSGSHSDNIMEPIPFLNGLALHHKYAESDNIYDEVIEAYKESEKRKAPYALIVDADDVNNVIYFERSAELKKAFEYKKDVTKTVVHPLLAEYQFKRYTAKKLDGDITTIAKPVLPNIPDDLSEALKPYALKYKTLFDVFKNIPKDFVTGDTSASSSYAFPPYNCIDMLTYIGGSIPLAMGAYLAGNKNVWALSGDFGFLSAGHMGLLEVVQREIPLKIVIFYNKKAAATGGQVIHKKVLYHILAGYENFITHISNPEDIMEIGQVLNQANESDQLSIILADY